MAASAMPCFAVAAIAVLASGRVASVQAYDCSAELWAWEQLWTPDWKEWCCKHEQKGCPSTSTVTATSTSTLTQTSTHTTVTTTTGTRTSTQTTKNPCDNVCLQDGKNATCGARIVWASTHETQNEVSPCEAAQELVTAQCSDVCGGCTPAAAGCDVFSDRIEVMKKFEQQEVDAPRSKGTSIRGTLLLLGVPSLALVGFVVTRHRATPRAYANEEELLVSEGEA